MELEFFDLVAAHRESTEYALCALNTPMRNAFVDTVSTFVDGPAGHAIWPETSERERVMGVFREPTIEAVACIVQAILTARPTDVSVAFCWVTSEITLPDGEYPGFSLLWSLDTVMQCKAQL